MKGPDEAARLRGTHASIEDLYDAVVKQRGIAGGGNKLYSEYARLNMTESRQLVERIGIDLSGYVRQIDEQGINHIAHSHPDIGKADLVKIPLIVKYYEAVELTYASRTGSTRIRYEGNQYVYIEEINRGRRKLVPRTLYKRSGAISQAPPATSKTTYPEDARVMQPENSATFGIIPGSPHLRQRFRVCLLQTLHAHDDKRMFHKLAMSLVGAGYEVVSIVPDTGEVPRERAGVRFVTIPRAQGLWRRFMVLPQLIRAGVAERADILIAPEPESWAAALAVKLLAGGRVVFDMHEHVQTEFSKFFPRHLRPFIEWLTVRVMRVFARFTSLIILTRESFDPPWKGLATPRVTVINTNHLQAPCSDVPEALRARYVGRPVLIHQGIFGDVRGSWQLLDAMKLLVKEFPDIVCIVLGEYVYGSLEEYRRAIRATGLEAHFDFPGVVPFEQVPAYIAVADVGLILFQPGPLNHTLAMPHKLFDYMREAKPVVAPDFALEVGRIVRESECGLLVDVANPAAIAQAAARLLRDKAMAQALGNNGRRAVEEKYNWQAEERVLLEAMKRVAEGA